MSQRPFKQVDVFTDKPYFGNPLAVVLDGSGLSDERMQRVAQDFAQQHLADQKLQDKDREGYTLLLAMRSWEFEAFGALRR